MTLSENLVKINLLRKGLDELRPLSREAHDKLWEKLRLEWNYNSNHIEGNTLTYSETKLLLLFDKTTGDHEKREYDEMQAHDVAIHLVRDWAQDNSRELTEADIKNLNEIILVKPYWKEALTYDGQPTRRLIKVGDYKEHPNSVRLKTGEMFHYASPEETPRLMQELIDWYRTTDIQHPLYLAAELHYKFIRIHPFDDGNGRIARLLVNYVLIKNGYTPIIIKSADKENYITALQKADAGDPAAFPNYMAEQLIWSLQLEDKAAKGEDLNEPGDLDKKLSLLERELELIDPDEEVKVHFSQGVFEEMLTGWIKDLVIKAIPVVQKFNRFFTGTRHSININQGMGYINFVDESDNDVLRQLLDSYEANKNSFQQYNTSFNLQTFYGTLKKGGLNTFGCNYGFEIKFEQIKYEVLADEFVEEVGGSKKVKLYERLLHKPLLPNEMDFIIDKLGDTIYKHIDFNTKKKGLR